MPLLVQSGLRLARRLASTASGAAPARSAAAGAARRTVFSGIQVTGVPHLGNYLGALRQWVQLQDTEPADVPCYYSCMDLHTLTTMPQAEQLRENSRRTAVTLLAVGLDPKRSCIFRQSDVSQHTELAWILSCHVSANVLNRMTQWKAKSSSTMPSLGLYSYPVLMAADILLYNTTHVPVGDDQLQHLELARDIASAFNERCGENVFVLPQAICGPAPRVMSLRKPTEKMSKSDPAENSRIMLEDGPDAIFHKIRRAVTDSDGTIAYDPENKPGITNLLTIYAALSTTLTTPQAVAEARGSLTTEQFKEELATLVMEHLKGIQTRAAVFNSERGHVDAILAEGAERARGVAADTMRRVRRAVGLPVL